MELILKILGFTVLGFFGLVLLYLGFLAICAYCFVSPKKEYDKNSRFYRRLLYDPTSIVLFFGRVHVLTTGLEKMPEGRFLLVSNHRSNFDPIVTWHVLEKYDLAYISKFENFKVPIWGRIIRKCCFLGINRTDAREGLKTIIKAVKLLKADEVSIGIYPEGTRSKDARLSQFHAGSFKTAQQAGVPVVVMTVRGTEKIHKNFPFRKSNVNVDILEVIPAEEAKALKTQELSEKVREIMRANLPEEKDVEIQAE
ncbi:MAG: 1-acyl-sn-glycerol-3-phosphate acyltransferase [Lachnospiraceae bacterium]|nr:1-acyl-sn-glycerol-3-phosphate acyltransferase [Lachnospiraceae bacterium]MBP5183520.1 1-acyl-sn-glycerol-3-phosphate acyltransferase [Lachnospiraceae bacterium]